MRFRYRLPATLGLLAVFAAPVAAQPAASQLKYYELRTYHAAQGKLDGVKDEFKSWIIPGLQRAGIKPVAYWVKQDEADPAVVYLMAFSSKEERDAAWAKFRADPETTKGRAQTAARQGGNSIAKADIVFMEMTDFSPHPKTSDGIPLE